ncbi:diacylglycerol lipase-beta-like [Prorops nasuta]|uniref:diacylglycerol lipase-beta-like n=1 Tax=Prorops nasuta TaxID=863751 RepID=UPI0034CEC247
MPALKLFGRKWLAATDDLVYPGLFEILIRVVWLILIGVASVKYYEETWNCRSGGELVRVYLVGESTILGIVTLLIFMIVRQSAKGSITNTAARRSVEPLLTVKILLILPEIGWNILASLWLFGKHVECSHEHYTVTVVEALVFFDWILIGLSMVGLALVFDPLGSIRWHQKDCEDSVEHGRASRIWMRRFKFLWWMRQDESAHETFQHVAGLLSALFRGTDLVPSDVLAGCILLRVRQKRQVRELRRLNLLNRPNYTSDASSIFAGTPSWMTLENAHHHLQLSIASYGWLFVIYRHICTGCFTLIRGMTCCACFRRKRHVVLDDNCCLCNLSGVKHLSDVSEDDILFASFKNHLCEVPFLVIADHKTASIVVVVRGSLSLRDLITDIAAASDSFEPEGLPPGSMAHKGMIIGAKVILKTLNDFKVLESAFATYPNYHLTFTGHSLGAGIAVLLGVLLRPLYPGLRIYAFATPAGLLSREAAKVTEDFVLTIGLGDDLVMRLSVDSTENFRTSLLLTLRACRLPKYRVVLNGFGYALFGVPERDLNKTWTNYHLLNSIPGERPLLLQGQTANQSDNSAIERDLTRRRFSSVRLYNAGKILHLARCKNTDKSENSNKKRNDKEKKYEMRWAEPEDFLELSVMPRMLLDHLPENLESALATLIQQQQDIPFYFDP